MKKNLNFLKQPTNYTTGITPAGMRISHLVLDSEEIQSVEEIESSLFYDGRAKMLKN